MLKNMHIGMSPLSHEIFAYRGKGGVATDKSEPLTSEAVFAVAHLVLAKGEPVTVRLDGEDFELRIYAKATA
jgi:hypothetical protein